MKDKIKELIDKIGMKKLAIIGAVVVIAIVGTVVGVSALKPANEVVEEDTSKDKVSDTDNEEADEKTDDTETKEDVAQETVVEEEKTEEQAETTEDTTSATTGNTNNSSTTNNATTTTPSNNTSNSNTSNNSSVNQNTQTITNPAYGTVLTKMPSTNDIQFSNWGWKAMSMTYTWEKYEPFEGDIREHWVGYFPGAMMSADEQIEWLKYGDGMIERPARLGHYEGEQVEYTVWIWMDKETAGPTIDWQYPAYGTVVTTDPRDSHKGGIWGWKQQWKIWEWRTVDGEGYWMGAEEGYTYTSKDDPDNEWERFAETYIARPDREGAYVGEKIYKTAWVWLYK